MSLPRKLSVPGPPVLPTGVVSGATTGGCLWFSYVGPSCGSLSFARAAGTRNELALIVHDMAGLLGNLGVVARIRALRGAVRQRLSHQEVDSFDNCGFLLPLRIIEAEEAHATRQRIEALESEANQSGNSLFTNGHLLHRWQYDLATHPALVDAVEDLLGPNLLIWKCQLWIKEAHSRSYIGWHQDAAYWGLEPPDSVNAWIALTDVTSRHGPMELYARSHTEPLMAHEDTYDADNMLTRGQTIPFHKPSAQNSTGGGGGGGGGGSVVELDASRVVPAVLAPGECSLHHLCTAHGGGPNEAGERRIGFNVTFVAPHVCSVRAPGARAMIARGCHDAGALEAWELDPPPPITGPPTPECVAAHAAKNAGIAASIMEGADLDAFRRVSEERVGRNMPGHVTASAAAATSLASALLADGEGATPA